MSRLAAAFAALKADGRTAFLPYITAGDPCLAVTEELVMALEQAGADIVELGIPYSDPLADGPTIQRAAGRALAAGTRVAGIFAAVDRLRTTTSIPLVFLVYANTVLQYGREAFFLRCAEAGVDGVIIPDLPLDERLHLLEFLRSEAVPVDLVPLVAPTSAQRTAAVAAAGTGFVYCVSSLGVTGARSDLGDLGEFLQTVRQASDLPLCVGFGVSTPAMAASLCEQADGVIVGSAIIQELEEGLEKPDLVLRVQRFAQQFRHGLDSEASTAASGPPRSG